jgi:dTDP-4-dehydrorhamnose 3,5-epimerase
MARKVVFMTDWLLEGAVKDTQSVTTDWEPVGRALIDGVIVKETRVVPKGNGSVVELYRADWFEAGAQAAGQVFVTRISVGGLSAWHAHAETRDRLTILEGHATLVLYDGRPGSATHGRVNEFHLIASRPTTIVVPARVWHGVRNVGAATCLVVNIPDIAYRYTDPDHYRLPYDTREIPYRFPSPPL